MNAALSKKALTDRDWRRLVETIHHGHCILVLGPDASLEKSGDQCLPITKKLAQHLIGKMKPDASTKDPEDLPHIAQLYLHQKNDRH